MFCPLTMFKSLRRHKASTCCLSLQTELDVGLVGLAITGYLFVSNLVVGPSTHKLLTLMCCFITQQQALLYLYFLLITKNSCSVKVFNKRVDST